MCGAMGDSGLAVEKDFLSIGDRRKNAAALDARIERWTRRFPAEEVVERLQRAGVPAGVVQNTADLAADPHLTARNFFVPIHHPVMGKTLANASPMKFRGEPRPSWERSPLLGEHNRRVFQGFLGLTEEEYSFYVQQGAIV